ncbi:MAG: hypothetical protein WDW38_006214 [Sanguina aurantia]
MCSSSASEVFDTSILGGSGPPLQFPAVLPILPFPVNELLAPGSTKVLNLFEPRYLALVEATVTRQHQVFVHTMIEEGAAGRATLARCPSAHQVGKHVLCSAVLVKVMEIKEAPRGVIVRVRAEGRVAIKALRTVEPYITGVVVPVLDAAPPLVAGSAEGGGGVLWALQAAVRELEEVMRDVQNLARKFKCVETTNLAHALDVWVGEKRPVMVSTELSWLSDGEATPAAAAAAAAAAAGPSNPTASATASVEPSPADAESLASSGRSEGEATAAVASVSAGASETVEGGGGLSGDGSSSSGSSSGSGVLLEAMGRGMTPDPALLLDLERASRLSFAALQLLPQATAHEKAQCLVEQRKAMEMQDTLARLQHVLAIMTTSRNMLAAKCALKGLNMMQL